MLPRVFAWIKNILRHRLSGESLIAFGSHGEELLHEEEWSALPPKERAKWEPTDESNVLYRRKPW
jgi:hypothetical protein